LSFIAVANAVTYCNAKPVFVDSHQDYWCIDPKKIEEKVTGNTKAIIPVHLYGHPTDMDSILNVARGHNLYVIEDAAEAHGAEYKGKKVGSLSDISCFSFYGNKIITTGEGGMCLTNNEKLAEKMRILRDHGMSPNKRYWHIIIGFNYRMTNMQAAVGVAQLKKLDEFVEKKRQIARLYNSLLKDIDGIITPPEMSWAKNVYWMYSALIEDDFLMGRDELMKKLAINGIETRPFFHPIHEMVPYNNNEKFEVAESLSMKGMNFPSSVTLKKEDLDVIFQSIIKCLK
jgi:perosamine synthetase